MRSTKLYLEEQLKVSLFYDLVVTVAVKIGHHQVMF